MKDRAANSLLKSLDRIPLTYKDENKLVWGDSLNICLYKVKEGILKLEFGYALNEHDNPPHILFTLVDESYPKLEALISKDIEIVKYDPEDKRFPYVAKVIGAMVLYTNDLKRGSQV